MSATLNGFRVVSVRIVTRWRGPWFADVDCDPEDVSLLPSSGPATLILGTPPQTTTALVAKIDPLASGSMVATKRLRVASAASGGPPTCQPRTFLSRPASSPRTFTSRQPPRSSRP